MEGPSILDLEPPIQRKQIFLPTRRSQCLALLDPGNQDCLLSASVPIKQLSQKEGSITNIRTRLSNSRNASETSGSLVRTVASGTPTAEPLHQVGHAE